MLLLLQHIKFQRTQAMPGIESISSEVFQDCETIFGSDIQVSADFLKYLQPVGIKAAYRKRALETHPDRAVVLDTLARDLNAEFINVREAYERLLSFVETRNKWKLGTPYFDGWRTRQTYSSQNFQNSGERYCNQSHWHKKQKNYADHFYNGSIPKVNLMLGQFLYYSGLISWRTLIEAICWQRRQRPLIGQIATSWGLLSYQDVLQILAVRDFDEKFGECAFRTGYISIFELFALLGKQKKFQRPLGEYFIERGILSSTEIIKIIERQLAHNLSSFK